MMVKVFGISGRSITTVILWRSLEQVLILWGCDSWNSKYEIERVKLLQLNLIEQFEDEDTAFAFIYDNIKYPKFRERAILYHLDKENYNQVIELCEEGENTDDRYQGLISKWKKYRAEAYEALEDTEKERELKMEFLLGGEFEYYQDLKHHLYEADEWEKVLGEILSTFEKQRHPDSAYVEILKEEKLYDRLLNYTNQRPSEIQTLFPYLIEDYFDEVNKIYQQFIKTEAERATDRKKYKKVCKLIKSYKKVCSEINAHKLISELEKEYERRPAFIDELEKIK